MKYTNFLGGSTEETLEMDFVRKALMNLANWPNEDKVSIRANDLVFFNRLGIVLKHSEPVEVVKEQL